MDQPQTNQNSNPDQDNELLQVKLSNKKNIKNIRKSLLQKPNSVIQQNQSAIKRSSQILLKKDVSFSNLQNQEFPQDPNPDQQEVPNQLQQPNQDFSILKEGNMFLKFGLKSMFGPQIRYIFFTEDLTSFCWAAQKGDKVKTSLPVKEITNITLGRSSVNFKYYKLQEKQTFKEDLSFSIYFSKRSVDLEASSVEIRDLFYNEIVKLIKLNNPSFEPKNQQQNQSTISVINNGNNMDNYVVQSQINVKESEIKNNQTKQETI